MWYPSQARHYAHISIVSILIILSSGAVVENRRENEILAVWLAGWQPASWAGWLASRLAGWLTGSLAGWLAGRPFSPITTKHNFVNSEMIFDHKFNTCIL